MSNRIDYEIAELLENTLTVKKFGLVKRKNKEFWRNYHREIKKSKHGITKTMKELLIDAVFKPNLLWEYGKEKLNEKNEHI